MRCSTITTFVVLCLVQWVRANRIFERDAIGAFTLEKGDLPFCKSNQLGADLEIESLKYRRFYRVREQTDIYPYFHGTHSSECRNQKIVRKPASISLFGASASSFGDVITTKRPLLCTFNNSYNVTLTAALPTKPTTVKGVRLTTNKRYIFITSGSGSCVFSAPFLKRIDVRGSYTLVRSPFLKTPPSYCKSSLRIGGIPGQVDASEMLFDGQPDNCQKGKLNFVQDLDLNFPVVSNLVKKGVPYFGASPTPLFCGNTSIFAGAAKTIADASLGNIATLRGARYFGMVDTGPDFDYEGRLNNLRVCLYASYNQNSGGIWNFIRTIFST